MLPLVIFVTSGLVALASAQVRTSFASPHAAYTTEYNLGGYHYHPRHYDAGHAHHHGTYGRYAAYGYPYDYAHGYRDSHGHYHGPYGEHAHYHPVGYRGSFYRGHDGNGYPYNNYHYGYSPYSTGVRRFNPPVISAARSSALTGPAIATSQEAAQPVPTIPRAARDFETRYAAPTPYQFAYSVDGADGAQKRQESGDGSGRVNGAYSFVLPDGRQRRVEYTADEAGFRAKVDTNEPGTESQHPAAVQLYSSAVPAAQAALLSDPHRHP